MKKFLKVLLSVVLILIILALTAVSVFSLIGASENGTLSVGSYSFYIAKNVEAEGVLVENSLIVAQKSNVSDIQNGDYVLFENGESVSVRIVADFLSAGEPSFVLSSESSDEDIVVPAQMIYGKIVYTSTFIGSAVVFASSTVGMIVIGFLALIIVLLLVLFGTKKGSGKDELKSVEGALDKLAQEKNGVVDMSETQKIGVSKEVENKKTEIALEKKEVTQETIVISKKDLEGAPSDMIANILDKGVDNKKSESTATVEIEKVETKEVATQKEDNKPKETPNTKKSDEKKTAPSVDIGNLSAEDILKDLDSLL